MKRSPTKQALLKKWLKGQKSNQYLPVITKLSDNKDIALSLSQKRQLFLELLEPDTPVNNLSVLVELNGPLNKLALKNSVDQILSRHEVLRTQFTFKDGIPTPKIIDNAHINIPLIELHSENLSESIEEVHRLAKIEVLKPFDLSKSPLISLKLFALDKNRHFLLVVVHHCISDGWSLGVFLREMLFYYDSNLLMKPVKLPDLQIQYADFAYWQKLKEQKNAQELSLPYWKNQLSGELPTLELPTDKKRLSKQSFNGETYRFTLSKNITNSLESLSRNQDVTLFMTLLSCFYILLNRYSGQEDILIGTPIANRTLPELENLIGSFINTIVLRTNLSGKPSFLELLNRVKKISTEAYSNQNLPFERLVEELKPKRDLSRTPIFQVVFNMQNSPLPDLKASNLEVKFHEIDRGVSQFDMSLMVSKINEQCFATVEYNKDLFHAATIKRMFDSYQLILKNVIEQPYKSISEISVVDNLEISQLLSSFNETKIDFQSEKLVYQIIEEKAIQIPKATAIRCNKIEFTYLELNNRSNLIAHQLLILGAKTHERIGILMHRSADILPSLIAVHKIGAVFIPMHISIPEDRLNTIIKDADIKFLITDRELNLSSDLGVKLLRLDDKFSKFDIQPTNPNIQVSPKDLAYIIFTSGSTGKPKGVKITHNSLMNLLWSISHKPGIKKTDVMMAVTSISFDIALLELFLPLISGATLVIANEEMIANPILLSQELEINQISLMQATPATWQLLIKSGWKGKMNLKALCGGDVMTRELANELLDRVQCLWNMYGPTETTIWSSICKIHRDNKSITIGKPIANTQFYILDEYLNPVHYGIIGELYIGGLGLAKGYLNQDGLTNQKFISNNKIGTIGDRIYKTGDRAKYLNDDTIEVLGRKDDQIKINGYRIEIGEITEVLCQHHEINDAVVIARKEKNGEKRLIAYLITKNSKPLNLDKLKGFLKRKLPNYMIPVRYIILESFPLTTSGKVDRRSLPIPDNRNNSEKYTGPRNEKEKILVEIWQNVLEIEQVGIYDNFFDLGGASIQSLQIIAKANMYGIPMTIENLFEFQTIAELLAHLE